MFSAKERKEDERGKGKTNEIAGRSVGWPVAQAATALDRI
jgi:hypothetical protein